MTYVVEVTNPLAELEYEVMRLELEDGIDELDFEVPEVDQLGEVTSPLAVLEVRVGLVLMVVEVEYVYVNCVDELDTVPLAELEYEVMRLEVEVETDEVDVSLVL